MLLLLLLLLIGISGQFCRMDVRSLYPRTLVDIKSAVNQSFIHLSICPPFAVPFDLFWSWSCSCWLAGWKDVISVAPCEIEMPCKFLSLFFIELLIPSFADLSISHEFIVIERHHRSNLFTLQLLLLPLLPMITMRRRRGWSCQWILANWFTLP